MYMIKSEIRPELLKTCIARIARGSLAEGFSKSGHILANVLDQLVHRQQYIFAEEPVNLHDFASLVV